MGKWALITGASSGIGKALAIEFAKNGFNLFLTARIEKALRETAEYCKKFNIETDIFPADLAETSSTDGLVKVVSRRKFDVLVNNAGFGIKGDFTDTNLEDEIKMLDVQLSAMLKITKAVLPKMIQQKRGNILNVASVYSFAPVSKQAVYSASKAFILNFSAALQAELKESNILVSTLCPGITQTEFRKRAGIFDKKNTGMTAERVAEIAFDQMSKQKKLIIPGFQNKLFVFLSKHLPLETTTAIVKFINKRRGINKKL